MARTYQQIYEEILSAKEANANLTALNSAAGETFADFLATLLNKTLSKI